MSADSQVHKEIRRLLWAMRDDALTPDDAEQLREMLLDDPKAREFYVWHMFLAGSLEWDHSAGTSGQWPVVSGQWSDSVMHPSSFIPHPSTIPPIVVDPNSAGGSTFGSFVFSHVAAAVILGIGLLIGLTWRISLPSSEGPVTAPKSIAKAVGRITALADCQWSKQGSGVRGPGPGISKTEDLRPKTFFLGDRLSVTSGLMEITYDTGAKVILQGPCTYEIDSARSGYLAVGKLTARIVASGQWPVASKTKQKKHEAESLTTGHRPLATALFAVRTPTATVTDLGTEFGVEVESTGATRSHVFQGSVEVRWSNSRRITTSEKSVDILHAGQSVRVERDRKGVVTVTREPSRAGHFVRHISNPKSQITKSIPPPLVPRPTPAARMSPEAYADFVLSLGPAAYYRMERPRSEKNRRVVRDFASGGRHAVFCSRDPSVMPYVPGKFGDAMAFRGNRFGDCVFAKHLPPTKNNQLTLVAWVMADAQQPGSIMASRWNSLNSKNTRSVAFPFRIISPLPHHRWQHFAYVVNNESGGTALRIYRNASEPQKNHFSHVWPDLSEVFWGIGGVAPSLNPDPNTAEQYWQGWIDEVAIFHKALPHETIKQLYLGGTPVEKGERDHE